MRKYEETTLRIAFAIMVVAVAAFAFAALTAAKARAEYVKKPVTAQQRIEAQCNMAALSAMNGFDIWGDAIVAYGVKNNCMNAHGYVYKRPARSAKAQRPAGTSARQK
jgi:hypothetical protein